ncbi:hypothetical protein MMYC01_207455 [Madurella mycetomatis]|uniref:Fungal N-terminal domain-containing protein n=1 Tax=Madurella mycetomatis TaxID=100816 RepID=A0A175VWW8_9PEZI|nr:hypothetical protein MMYC01_207455 [Madurella mycetomatis]
MDPLSALGIAAAVVQFVDFGGRLLSKAWESAGDLAAELKELQTQTSTLSENLHKASAHLRRDGPTAADRNLARARDDCDRIAAEIQDTLDRARRRERRFPFAIWEPTNISAAKARLENLRRAATESVLFCIWQVLLTWSRIKRA